MAYYYATISQIDHHVGRLIALLKEKRLYDNTLIVFTADHGEYLGYHHLLLKGNHMYDPLVKVPLVIKWPDGRRAGSVSQRLVSNVDLAPTLCRAAGLQPAAEMRGEDLGTEGPGARSSSANTGQSWRWPARDLDKLILVGMVAWREPFLRPAKGPAGDAQPLPFAGGSGEGQATDGSHCGLAAPAGADVLCGSSIAADPGAERASARLEASRGDHRVLSAKMQQRN